MRPFTKDTGHSTCLQFFRMDGLMLVTKKKWVNDIKQCFYKNYTVKPSRKRNPNLHHPDIHKTAPL